MKKDEKAKKVKVEDLKMKVYSLLEGAGVSVSVRDNILKVIEADLIPPSWDNCDGL